MASGILGTLRRRKSTIWTTRRPPQISVRSTKSSLQVMTSRLTHSHRHTRQAMTIAITASEGLSSICVNLRHLRMYPCHMDPKEIVHSDPEIVSGTPVFVGTRVPAQALLDYLGG